MKLYCEDCDQIYDTESGPQPLAYPDRWGKRFACTDCGERLVSFFRAGPTPEPPQWEQD